MKREMKRRGLPLILALWFVMGAVLATGKKPIKRTQSAAPVPRQILTARTAFISNGGEVCISHLAQFGEFASTPTVAYDRFYEAMAKWGRYKLASAPDDSQVDLVITFRCDPSFSFYTLTLTVRDPRTNVLLWRLKREKMEWAGRKVNRERNFNLALTQLVKELETLVKTAQPATAMKTSN